jgi:MoxR-like ATPase
MIDRTATTPQPLASHSVPSTSSVPGHPLVRAVRENIARVVIGQDEVVERMLIALVTAGHLLLQGVPGLAKTLPVSALARAVDLQFGLVQFTIDLLPSDCTGGRA